MTPDLTPINSYNLSARQILIFSANLFSKYMMVAKSVSVTPVRPLIAFHAYTLGDLFYLDPPRVGIFVNTTSTRITTPQILLEDECKQKIQMDLFGSVSRVSSGLSPFIKRGSLGTNDFMGVPWRIKIGDPGEWIHNKINKKCLFHTRKNTFTVDKLLLDTIQYVFQIRY